MQARRKRVPTFMQRTGKHENWIHTSHLSIDGNRMWTPRGGVEYHDWPNWDQHPAHLRFGEWLTLRLCEIDCGLNPRPFPDRVRKHAKLTNGSSAFTRESFRRQAGFRRNSGYQIITKGNDL